MLVVVVLLIGLGAGRWWGEAGFFLFDGDGSRLDLAGVQCGASVVELL